MIDILITIGALILVLLLLKLREPDEIICFQEKESYIEKLRRQRSFLARKFKELSDENNKLKLDLLKAEREAFKKEKQQKDKENELSRVLKENKELAGKIKKLLSTNTIYRT